MRYVIDPRCQPQRFTDRHWWLVPVLLLLACLLNAGCGDAQAAQTWRTAEGGLVYADDAATGVRCYKWDTIGGLSNYIACVKVREAK